MLASDILDLRTKPVPDEINRKLNYREYPIDLDSQYNAERLVDIRTFGLAGDNFYYRRDNPPYFRRIDSSIEQLYLRETVAGLLGQVNADLAPLDLEIYVFDAFRPIEIQNYMHDRWFPEYLLERNPELSQQDLFAEVEKYWAKGSSNGHEIDPRSPPPHSTGAAIDLTIRSRVRGDHLFMGTIFDDVSKLSHTAFYEGPDGNLPGFSEEEAARNRRLLYWIMVRRGFVNNPTEWWHFSWGDQMWAKISGKPTALYSNATLNMRSTETPKK
jgi:D-alanyl-D-alanine dipeptidase